MTKSWTTGAFTFVKLLCLLIIRIFVLRIHIIYFLVYSCRSIKYRESFNTEEEKLQSGLKSEYECPPDLKVSEDFHAKAKEFSSLLEVDKQKIEDLESRIKLLQKKSSARLQHDIDSQISRLKSLEESVTSGYSKVENEKAKFDSEFESLQKRRLEQKKDSASLIPRWILEYVLGKINGREKARISAETKLSIVGFLIVYSILSLLRKSRKLKMLNST